MSYSAVIGMNPHENTWIIKELRNSWGSANLVWSAMAAKYFHDKLFWMTHGGNPSPFWALHADLRLSPAEKAVFMMTFDGAYIAQKDFPRAIADISDFFWQHPVPLEYVFHWPTIKEILATSDAPAIGFWWTSVCSNPWAPHWDDNDVEIPLDWGKAWDLYAELDKKGEL